MQIKTIKPFSVLRFRTETTVEELKNYLQVGQELLAEAVTNKLFICGPIHWHYFGFTGDEKRPFTLEIVLPISAPTQSHRGKFETKTTDAYKCVSAFHQGGWMEIPKTYGSIFQFIEQQKLHPTGHNREIYIHVDLHDPSANITEIQIGIE